MVMKQLTFLSRRFSRSFHARCSPGTHITPGYHPLDNEVLLSSNCTSARAACPEDRRAGSGRLWCWCTQSCVSICASISSWRRRMNRLCVKMTMMYEDTCVQFVRRCLYPHVAPLKSDLNRVQFCCTDILDRDCVPEEVHTS